MESPPPLREEPEGDNKECRARGHCESLNDVYKLLPEVPEKQQLRHLYIDRDTISFNFNRIGI